MAAWITRLDTGTPGGIRLAVKDAIDVEGVPTTVGCAAIADTATAATADADCVATARAAGARIVGKTNLHELCFGTSGINPWFGTPVNPVAPDRVPGGSSSGSAVAVANDEADVGYGTDTGGSVRIPAACCGLVGLKTTFGRISTAGVWPLSRSLDTVGPIARTVTDAVAGMALLERGFTPAAAPAARVGRVRLADVDPDLDAAVDRALADAELEVVDVELPSWDTCNAAFMAILLAEAWEADGHLLAAAPDRVSDACTTALRLGETFTPAQVAEARAGQAAWQQELAAAFADGVEVLALPTLAGIPPRLDRVDALNLTRLTRPLNLSGTPALSLPVPVEGWSLPGSLQLCGPAGSEELLCATGLLVEEARGPGIR